MSFNLPFVPGQKIFLDSRLELTVVFQLSSGRDRNVYVVRDANNVQMILKCAKETHYKGKGGIQNSVVRALAIQQFGLPHASVLEWSSSCTYALFQMIQGIRGDDWLRTWEKSALVIKNSWFDQLADFIRKASNLHTYIGKLDPEDMMLYHGEFWIVDSGSLKTLSSSDEVFARYRKKFVKRWGRTSWLKKQIELIFSELTEERLLQSSREAELAEKGTS